MKTRTTIVALALLALLVTARRSRRPFVNAFLSCPQVFPYQRLEAERPRSAWCPIDRWQPHCFSFPTEETSVGKEQT